MKRIILYLLALVSIVYAQPSPGALVTRTLAVNNQTGNFTSLAGSNSSPTQIPNLGQTGHQALITFTSIPAMNCVTPTYTEEFDYSYDNSNWFVISPQSPGRGNIPGGKPGGNLLATAYGNYPFVRISVVWTDFVNCQLTVRYSGFNNSAANVTSQGSNYVVQTIRINIAAAATTQVIAPVAGMKIVITAGVLNVDTLDSAITITEGTGATCNIGTITLATFVNLPRGNSIYFNPGIAGIAIETQQSGDGLCIASTTGTTNGFISFIQPQPTGFGGVY